jgi:hypothetical protein
MVRGFNLTALNNLGKEEIKKLDVRDKGAIVSQISENPFIIAYLFKDRVKKFIPAKSVEFFVRDYFKDRLIENEDYRLEVLE